MIHPKIDRIAVIFVLAGLLLQGQLIETRTSNVLAAAETERASIHPAEPIERDYSSTADNPNPPSQPVKLIFIHHSTGEAWLSDTHGGLGVALRDNNYFVSDTNYGWGPDGIGNTTDIGHWYNWFRGPSSVSYTAALYAESNQHSSYSRLATNPGGENQIILFKSCFPNSDLDSPSTPIPPIASNPLRGQSAGSQYHTVANAKGIYIDLLQYFATRQDKLFIVIAAPPLVSSTNGDNARAFNNWLVDEWLTGYPYQNVAVFDFYNVLTSNGGSINVNDFGYTTGNHHRWQNGAVEHTQTSNNNLLSYPSPGPDDHPNAAGDQKATGEFGPLLNVYYHRWQSSIASLHLLSPNGGETLAAGLPWMVRWETGGSVAQVDLVYSTDDFQTTQPIASGISNSGSYAWLIPLSPMNGLRLRVSDTGNASTRDDSDGTFRTLVLSEKLYLPEVSR